MFFSNGYLAGSTETLDQLKENTNIQPSMYDDYLEGAYAAVAESVENSNRLMMAIGINEAVYYAETGEEYVYTESVIDDVINKVKSILNKLWEKIKSLFKRFVAIFDKFFASDKAFVKKYRKRIEMAKTEDVSYEGYKFPGLAKENVLTLPTDKNLIEGDYIDKDDKVEEIVGMYRGTIIGKNEQIDAGDFSKELEEYLVGDKEVMEGSELEIEKQLDYISNYADTKKQMEKQKTNVDRFFKQAISDLDNHKKTFTKSGKAAGTPFKGDEKRSDPTDSDTSVERDARDTVASFNRKRTVLTQKAQACTVAVGAYLNALKKRNRQARAICVKVMSKGGAFDSQNESATFEYPAYGSNFLNQVRFI